MMIPRYLFSGLFMLLALSASVVGSLADTDKGRYYVAGPVEAELVSVVDGDTVMVNARPWPQQTVSVLVRIRGIDTPEIHARCAKSRELALRAKTTLSRLLGESKGPLMLSDISGDKYFGRVVAAVSLDDQRDVGEEMLASGLARPYDGGRKAKPLCS